MFLCISLNIFNAVHEIRMRINKYQNLILQIIFNFIFHATAFLFVIINSQGGSLTYMLIYFNVFVLLSVQCTHSPLFNCL